MPPGRTKAQDVFMRMRGDILGGVLRPGQRLRYGELCGVYGTSMGVLRESLVRLAEQGLVRGEQQQGFQVSPLSGTDLRDLSDAREEIEGLALRRAVADGDVAWESRLLAAHHELARTPVVDGEVTPRVSEDWAAAHACFHDTLLDGCANVRLRTIAASLRDAAEVYRRWAFSLGRDRDRDVAAEHAAILEATLQRDADLAAALLRAHIRRTTTALLAALED
ncbi:GntR family transcriptional regulator [Streptomyces sp. NPDC050287]|uniref:GntR family transcriptional regulator n=1 Tax=Streptomyces sp. NPDC050287 TaxID=3365608 RepID=UPI00379A6792